MFYVSYLKLLLFIHKYMCVHTLMRVCNVNSHNNEQKVFHSVCLNV